MPIDYARMKVAGPKQKAALTRAQKKGYTAVLQACKDAVKEWNEIGAWPDSWSRWQRALVDAANQHTHKTGVYVNAPQLDSL